MNSFREFDPRIVSGQYDPSEGLFTFIIERKLIFTLHDQRVLQANMLDFLRRTRETPHLPEAPYASRTATWVYQQDFRHHFETICLPVYVTRSSDASPTITQKMIGNRLFLLLHLSDVRAAVAYRLRWNSNVLPEGWQSLDEKGLSPYCPIPPLASLSA